MQALPSPPAVVVHMLVDWNGSRDRLTGGEDVLLVMSWINVNSLLDDRLVGMLWRM